MHVVVLGSEAVGRVLALGDGVEFLVAAAQLDGRTEVETFPLLRAQDAVARLRAGEVRGAAVLIP